MNTEPKTLADHPQSEESMDARNEATRCDFPWLGLGIGVVLMIFMASWLL